MFQKMRRYEETHMLATVQKSGKYALPPQRVLLFPVTWPAVWYIRMDVWSLPSPPPGESSGNSSFDKQHARRKLDKAMYLVKLSGRLYITMLIWHNNWKKKLFTQPHSVQNCFEIPNVSQNIDVFFVVIRLEESKGRRYMFKHTNNVFFSIEPKSHYSEKIQSLNL